MREPRAPAAAGVGVENPFGNAGPPGSEAQPAEPTPSPFVHFFRRQSRPTHLPRPDKIFIRNLSADAQDFRRAGPVYRGV